MAFEGKTLGLALSGGGFRATLFGLGSLWRLNDAGLLGHIDRVSSVSGGSIAAGVLAHRWKDLAFVDGKATNFVELVAQPLRSFCQRNIDVATGLKGLITPFKSAGDFLADTYEDHLVGKTLMRDLPVAGPGNPRFIFYATNIQTGRSFRFRQDMLADYLLGTSTQTDVKLAFAIAASSAFPPVFSCIKLRMDPSTFSQGAAIPGIEDLRREVVLGDGGIYDNMGLESLVDNADVVLVSDAGAPMEIDEDPNGDYVRQMWRVRDILIEQTRALRKRWLITEFKSERKRGGYWGIGTKIEDYEDTDSPFKDTQASNALVAVPTRLARFDDPIPSRLVNWGYVLCDVSIRKRAKLAVPPATALPLPDDSL
jgi:NTE family protein